MVSLAFLLVLAIALHLSKIGAFVMRSKVDCQLCVVAGCFLFILLHATLYDHIHVFVSITLLVNLLTRLVLLER